MTTAQVVLGRFQLRCGRVARIDKINEDGSGNGVLVAVGAGKDELGHAWRKDGSYFTGNVGMFHHLDLMEKVP